MTGKKIYPACVSRNYAPEELRSMEVWDAYCESEPLTLEEIRACNLRDKTLMDPAPGKRKRKCQKNTPAKNRRYRDKYAEYFAMYRELHREEINARQRAYDAAHREEINRKCRERRLRKKLEKTQLEGQEN